MRDESCIWEFDSQGRDEIYVGQNPYHRFDGVAWTSDGPGAGAGVRDVQCGREEYAEGRPAGFEPGDSSDAGSPDRDHGVWSGTRLPLREKAGSGSGSRRRVVGRGEQELNPHLS